MKMRLSKYRANMFLLNHLNKNTNTSVMFRNTLFSRHYYPLSPQKNISSFKLQLAFG